MFADELQGKDPVIQLAPTGISAFEIWGWTINFGLSIPVKEGKEFQQLGDSALQRSQTRWRSAKLLILNEKSMVGHAQMGWADRRLWQVFPAASDDTLGGLPAIFFGDFAQLPPIVYTQPKLQVDGAWVWHWKVVECLKIHYSQPHFPPRRWRSRADQISRCFASTSHILNISRWLWAVFFQILVQSYSHTV